MELEQKPFIISTNTVIPGGRPVNKDDIAEAAEKLKAQKEFNAKKEAARMEAKKVQAEKEGKNVKEERKAI